jgi:amylosucrase
MDQPTDPTADGLLRPVARRRAEARASLARLLPELLEETAEGGPRLDGRDAELLTARIEHRYPDVHGPISDLYGDEHEVDEIMGALLTSVVAAARERPEALRRLDLAREVDPHWHLDERQVGYVCYADRFAGDLRGVVERLDYLEELGVTYLHLMPLLQPREGDADGGYAVADYREVDRRLGKREDLVALTTALRERGMSLCVDLVVNHTAREHAWAQAAMAGDERHRAYYRIHPDRQVPDRFEATLPEVFPETAPGSFTWVEEVDGWVWTTFRDFQWDLDYRNPEVVVELLDVMLDLVNQGVEVLRLDAVPFLWKREGTDCQNQPEVHAILQAWRNLLGMAAPAVRCKAEAIVPPGQLVPYLGAPVEGPVTAAGGLGSLVGHARPECDLAYHNQLMVLLWSSLAARDAQLATHALSRMRTPPPWAGWVTYIRGHDDIGWAITDEDAGAVGADAAAHRRFLIDFYAGDFPMSFASGRRFQENELTGDARTSGMTSVLAGVAQARELGDEALLDQAIRRVVLLHGVAASYGGIPLLWMGDELALGDDLDWETDPERALDNRWSHRPRMDWDAAARRHDAATVEGRVFASLRHLLAVRAATPELRAGGRTEPLWPDHPAVLAYVRSHPRTGRLLVLASFSDLETSVDMRILSEAGLGPVRDLLEPTGVFPYADGRIVLPPLGLRWLAEDR